LIMVGGSPRYDDVEVIAMAAMSGPSKLGTWQRRGCGSEQHEL
jgi:hypothetical protein